MSNQADTKIYRNRIIKNMSKIIIKRIEKFLPGEEFREITPDIVPNVPPYYMISNKGRLYSAATGKFLKPEIDKDGYFRATLAMGDGTNIHKHYHRLEMLAFNPISNPSEMQVNHIDGNKQNVIFLI